MDEKHRPHLGAPHFAQDVARAAGIVPPDSHDLGATTPTGIGNSIDAMNQQEGKSAIDDPLLQFVPCVDPKLVQRGEPER
jgi:hypothetical protein